MTPSTPAQSVYGSPSPMVRTARTNYSQGLRRPFGPGDLSRLPASVYDGPAAPSSLAGLWATIPFPRRDQSFYHPAAHRDWPVDMNEDQAYVFTLYHKIQDSVLHSLTMHIKSEGYAEELCKWCFRLVMAGEGYSFYIHQYDDLFSVLPPDFPGK
jgi:hypothetical protein